MPKIETLGQAKEEIVAMLGKAVTDAPELTFAENCEVVGKVLMDMTADAHRVGRLDELPELELLRWALVDLKAQILDEPRPSMAAVEGNPIVHSGPDNPPCELGTWHEGPCVPLADQDDFYANP